MARSRIRRRGEQHPHPDRMWTAAQYRRHLRRHHELRVPRGLSPVALGALHSYLPHGVTAPDAVTGRVTIPKPAQPSSSPTPASASAINRLA